MPIWAIVVIAVAAVVVLWLIVTYNKLVNLRARVKNAWAQIDVNLKRRFDLIPNLVSTVKGYAAHESGTLEKVVEARSHYETAATPAERMEASNELTSTLSKLMLLVENYPDLKANQNFLDLQNELRTTEDKIAFTRQFYNDTVMKLNAKLETFPTVMVAGMFGFRAEPYFEAEEEAAKAPKVEF